MTDKKQQKKKNTPFDDGVDQATDATISAIVTNYVEQYKKTIPEKKESQKPSMSKADALRIMPVLGEYLDDYILFGYDVSGERIMINQVKTAKGFDALLEMARQVSVKLSLPPESREEPGTLEPPEY